MQIRKEQLDVLTDQMLATHVTDLVETKSPKQWNMPRDVADKVARHTITIAKEYGLLTERDIGNFALNMLTINPEFHLQLRIHAILTDRAVSIDERMERITSDATEEDWREAAKMTDAGKYWTNILRAAGMP